MTKGLDIAREYYLSFGREMIDNQFGAYRERIAVGLAGEGSECFGVDDHISQDHDFGAAFCMWLTDADYAEIGESLNEAYRALPSSFCGFPRRELFSGGAQRVGAMRVSDFFAARLGVSRVPPRDSPDQWLRLPETALATVTNGETFYDALGAFSGVRNAFLEFYPEDVRLKKLAARLGRAAQSGQYNYARCLRRDERVAALLALAEFVNAAMSAVYLLNRRYMPFYKWAHRCMSALPKLGETRLTLSEIEAFAGAEEASVVAGIEDVCAALVREMKEQGLTGSDSDFLLDHCAHVMARVRDARLRSMDVFAG